MSKGNAFSLFPLLVFGLMFAAVLVVSSNLGLPKVPPNVIAVEALPSSGIYKADYGYIFKVCSPELGGCTKCTYDKVIKIDSASTFKITADNLIHRDPCSFYQVKDTSEIMPSYEHEKLQSDVRIKTI